MIIDLHEDMTDEDIQEVMIFYSKLLNDPETSFEDSLAVFKRFLDWEDAPTAWRRAYRIVCEDGLPSDC